MRVLFRDFLFHSLFFLLSNCFLIFKAFFVPTSSLSKAIKTFISFFFKNLKIVKITRKNNSIYKYGDRMSSIRKKIKLKNQKWSEIGGTIQRKSTMI